MITERLYDKDAYLKEFSSVVVSSEGFENGFLTVLESTAFFPESGGQFGDRGYIDGVKVLDTQIKDGIIYHTTEKAIKTGKTVNCEIDFARRFSFMQNHTGEHIVSGIVNKIYGFDNVGFHLGEDIVTLDFNGMLTAEDLFIIQRKANEKVWGNLGVKTYYPDKNSLEKINYRSKKELEGEVRIVEIENTDICACCAPHVARTGEVGLIKFLAFEKMRGGTRISMKCGSFALDDYNIKCDNTDKISSLLSAESNSVAQAVVTLFEKSGELKRENSNLKKKLADISVENAKESDNCIFTENLDMREIQLFADRLHKKFGGIRGVFSQTENGCSFALCGGEELDAFFAGFKSKFAVRGGGRNGMVQGSIDAQKEEIEEYFKENIYGLD